MKWKTLIRGVKYEADGFWIHTVDGGMALVGATAEGADRFLVRTLTVSEAKMMAQHVLKCGGVDAFLLLPASEQLAPLMTEKIDPNKREKHALYKE